MHCARQFYINLRNFEGEQLPIDELLQLLFGLMHNSRVMSSWTIASCIMIAPPWQGPIVMAVHGCSSCNVAERHLFVKSNLWNGATTVVELDLRCHAQTNPSLEISLSPSLSRGQNHLKREVKGKT